MSPLATHLFLFGLLALATTALIVLIRRSSGGVK